VRKDERNQQGDPSEETRHEQQRAQEDNRQHQQEFCRQFGRQAYLALLPTQEWRYKREQKDERTCECHEARPSAADYEMPGRRVHEPSAKEYLVALMRGHKSDGRESRGDRENGEASKVTVGN
jgi:hypothetical protein